MNLVMFETTIRIDKEGRYSLNDLHRAAIASGLDVERKNPAEFLRTDMAKNFIESLMKSEETTTEKSVLPFTVKNGGKNPGTYAVRLLAQRYCGWLSSDFEVMVYKTFDSFINNELQRKMIRESARDGFKNMNHALKTSIEDQGKSPKPYHYSNEADMINVIVLGKRARQYREEQGITDKSQTRDHQTKFQIYAIDELQNLDTHLIKMGLSTEQRRDALQKLFDVLLAKADGMDFDKLEQIKQDRLEKREARLLKMSN